MNGLEVVRRWDAGVAVLGVSGDLDLAGATLLMAGAEEAVRSGARSIVCDLRALQEPASSHLLTVFPAAQRRIGAWPQRAICLAGASPAVGRRLAKLGVDRFISVHDALDDALYVAHQDDHAVHRAVRLAPVLSSPARARECVDTLVAPAGSEVRDVVRIVVSELTTNVVRHVRCPFTLGLALSPDQLLVAVTDTSRQEPILRPVRAAAAEGRGIQLVDALSRSWGVRLVHRKGKTVWAKIPTTAA